jgi:hypothetical protein
MKPFLLYRDKCFEHAPSPFDQQLALDLQLEPVLRKMARHDDDLYRTARQVLMHCETDAETIRYRQDILRDFLDHPTLAKTLYVASTEIINASADYRSCMRPNLARTVTVRDKLKTAVVLLEIVVRRLQAIKSANPSKTLKSEGLTSLFARLENKYGESLIKEASEHLDVLQRAVRDQVFVFGARLGIGLKGNYRLRDLGHRHNLAGAALRSRLKGRIVLEYSTRDMEETALKPILLIVKHFIDEALRFAELLRFETGFYLSCVHLHEELAQRKVHVTFPLPAGTKERTLVFEDLYSPQLALVDDKPTVANSLHAANKLIFFIYGANQGGKTTLLRTIGLAQLMMQCGMFVPASFYQSNLCDRIFTHFSQPEDRRLISGKLDEELSRLNGIVNELTTDSLLLLNDPFSSTTEREGTFIAREMVAAFRELNIKTMVVTSFFSLAKWAYDEKKSRSSCCARKETTMAHERFDSRNGNRKSPATANNCSMPNWGICSA